MLLSTCLKLDCLYAESSNREETAEGPRRSSKVIISETTTDSVPQPIIERSMKSLLKSMSESMEKAPVESTADSQLTEARSPSIILEESVEKETKLPSTGTTGEERKIDKLDESKAGSAQERQKSIEETSGAEKPKEKKEEEEKLPGKGKNEQLEKQGSSSGDGDKKHPEVKGKNEVESDEGKDEPVTMSTTKPRGKSKATGRIMGGWI